MPVLCSPGCWIGVIPNRLSFGFTGTLYSVDIEAMFVRIGLLNLFFTNDVFDQSKIGLSGVASAISLVPGSAGTAYLLVRSRSCALRAASCQYRTESINFGTSWSVANFGDQSCSLKGVEVLKHWEIRLDGPWVRPLFLLEDDKWQQEEDLLKQNTPGWEKTLTILKKTLCPPTS